MNYLIFRSIVETMVTNFKCQQCGSSIEPQNIGIESISVGGIHLEVLCPQCHNKVLMNAEVNQVPGNIHETEQGRAMIDEISQKYGVEAEIGEITANIHVVPDRQHPQGVKNISITDADIMKMHAELKGKNITVSDIISQ